MSFLFAGIALLVLLPILYFLPLGFSLKGKGVIFALSLAISLVGLIATPILQLWQIVLILLLFVVLAAYLLTNKIEGFMEVPTEEATELMLPVDKAVISENVNDAYSYIATSDTKHEDTIETEEQTGIFAKAMRQAGEAKSSALFGNDHSDKGDDDLAIFTEEVAATSEDVNNEEKSETSYLADMEELLVVEEKVEKSKPLTYKHHEIAEIPVDDVKSTPTRLQGNLTLGEDELADIPGVDEIQTDKIESKPTAVLKSQEDSEDFLDELAEIPEADFEQEEFKKESELDADFWKKLLEADELEIIDDEELEKVK